MLTLDSFVVISAGVSFLRFCGNDPAAYEELRAALNGLLCGRAESVSVDRLPGVNAFGGLRLTATLGTRDRGVIRAGDGTSFVWDLSDGGWADVVGLLEPFCETPQPAGFQWLDRRGEVFVLLTGDGRW